MRALADNPHKNDFSRLLAELDSGHWAAELDAIKLHAQARGNNRAGEEFRKSLAATEEAAAALAPKPRRIVLVVRKDAPSAGVEIIAKAFHALKHGDLNADQRGRLMLKLADMKHAIENGQFAKALRTDSEPQSARSLAAKLKEVREHLDAHAEASHIAEAERLLADAKKMIANPESMSMGDHAALTIQLDDLRYKIESHSHDQG
jgi:hypothetical protein